VLKSRRSPRYSSSWKGWRWIWDNFQVINDLGDESGDGISQLKGGLNGYFK